MRAWVVLDLLREPERNQLSPDILGLTPVQMIRDDGHESSQDDRITGELGSAHHFSLRSSAHASAH